MDLCSLCPRTDQERARLPEPPLDGPMSDLHCGHQVHTHCLINELSNRRQRAVCAECQVTLMREEAITFYRNLYDNGPAVRQTLSDLWANNEEFRNDVKEYKKLSGKFMSSQRLYTKEVKGVKNRFKQNILTSVEVINDQKRQATLQVKALESTKVYKRAGLAYTRKLNSMRRKWDVSPWTLRELNDIEGAPKITRHPYIWRTSPKYLFRLKL